jgi:hypothetical protein
MERLGFLHKVPIRGDDQESHDNFKQLRGIFVGAVNVRRPFGEYETTVLKILH